MQTRQLLFGLKPNKYSKQCRPLAFECHRIVCTAVPCDHFETISKRFTNSEPFKEKLLISNRWHPRSLRALSSPPFTAHGVRVENDQLRRKTPHIQDIVNMWGAGVGCMDHQAGRDPFQVSGSAPEEGSSG